jgi:signal transduction histidine kinase
MRRLDTLFLRLFLLMWATLVAAHLVAYALSVPLSEPAGGVSPLDRLDPARLPVLPSLPPMGDPAAGRVPAGSGPESAPGSGRRQPYVGGLPPDLGRLPPDSRGLPPDPRGLPQDARALPLEGHGPLTRDGRVIAPPGARPVPGPGPGGPPGMPGSRSFLWIDYLLRAAVIAFGAALGARWLARPMRRLAAAAQALQQSLARGDALPVLDERRGTVEVREAARLFNRMGQRLREQFDARGLHLAAVSHDLRTPLTRLRLRLEALPPAEREAAAHDIAAIDALLDDTLAVLREQRAGEPERVDLGALLQALADDLAEQALPVELLPPAPGTLVRARPVALRRVLDNLVGNALRHGGNARLQARRDGDMVELCVDDDGPGIPPEQIARAFEPWVRLQEQGSGQGLGLAIARDLAERDGATLALANRAEGGLRARLRLPAG